MIHVEWFREGFIVKPEFTVLKIYILCVRAFLYKGLIVRNPQKSWAQFIAALTAAETR